MRTVYPPPQVFPVCGFAGGCSGACCVPVGYAYPSTGYHDELAWSALWLHRATGEPAYLSAAQATWSTHLQYTPDNFDWDDKTAGVALLLANYTSLPTAVSAVRTNTVYYTV